MPFKMLRLQPGVDIEESPTLNGFQLTASNLIRFYAGLVQKLGGWAALSLQTFVGTCRGLLGWADILGNPYIAVGTDQRLEVMIGGVLYDITPLVATDNPAVAFSTTISTPLVTITDASHNPVSGDWVNVQTQVAVGGLIIFGYYIVVSVPDATHFVINAGSNATATVAAGGAVPAYTTTNTLATVSVALAAHGFSAGSLFNAAVSTTVATVVISGIYSVTSITNANIFVITASGVANATTTASENAGNARIQYLLPSGYPVNTPLVGYGVGNYGAGDYGLSNSSSQDVARMRQWSLDHWGQDLIASPTDGAIYYWQPPSITPAVVVDATAPIYNVTAFVMPQVQIIVALGAETGSTQQPLLVRWCDAGNFADWPPSASNQAGSYLIPTGNRLLSGLAVGLGALLWTDADLWSMTYQGLPFVFGFNRVATACGIVSQRAAGISGSMVMWLSTRGFFVYSIGGGVTPMECSVWDFLINNVDTAQLGQIHCAVNALFNEFAWFFPILTTSDIYDTAAPLGYVKFNYVERVWDYGQSSQYQRTAWVGITPNGKPLGADTAGLLQQHEVGYDANGSAMLWSWQTGDISIGEGEDFAFVDMLIPDDGTSIGNPTVNYTVTSRYYPNSDPTVTGPYASIASGTYGRFIPLRVRGRQFSIGAGGSDLGTFNRLGGLRYRYAMDGRN